jgi:hypothetical protein
VLSAISGPLALLFMLGLIIFGYFALFAGITLVANYSDITLNVIFIVPILFLIWTYFKDRKKMISENLWKVESRTVLISGLILIVLISLNYWQGVVTAPVGFFFYGLYFISISYLISDDGRESAKKNAADISYSLAPLSSKIPKWVIGYIFVLLIISGYWFTEIQKTEQDTKDQGIESALKLAGYSIYFDLSSKASIRVDSIDRVYFTKVDSPDEPGKILEMCIVFGLEASRDGYYFESLYTSEQVCVKESPWVTGWSEYDLEEEVEKLVKGKFE